MSVKVFVPFFNWVAFFLLSVNSSLYVLDNSLLSDMSFANIFPQSVAYLLILLTVSFAEQKHLMFRKSSLSIFSFIGHAFGVYLEYHHQTQDCLDFLLCCLLRDL